MQALLLLHGALGAETQFATLKSALSKDFDLHSFNFRGHGGREMPEEPYRIKLFCQDVLTWMDQQKLDQIDIFGYSMGGYVALYLARHYPDRVRRIATLATKIYWEKEAARQEVKMLDADKIKEKVPKFAEMLKNRHAPLSWEKVLQGTADMMLALGESPDLSNEDLQKISHQVMIASGDKDKTVSPEETLQGFRALPNSSLWILPQTPHPFERVNISELAQKLTTYFSAPDKH